jgi:CubicO group peptidase (beta-lactamase class C family)
MALEAYLDEQNELGTFHGAALVRRGGHALLDRGFGFADYEQRRRNTRETVYQIASISKQFTAAAILLLHEQGALSLQDRAHTWIPDCPAAWEPMTLHHLLTHTSGIGTWEDLPELSLFEPKPKDDLLHIFENHPLKFPPGHGWAYSSPAFVLLAHIVEQVSAQPYATFLQQRIFQPLGMASTGAGNAAMEPSQQAQGYAGEEPAPSFELDTVGKGAGDIWSTTGDMERWDAALSTPSLLSAHSLRAMFAPHAAVPDEASAIAGASYGYGWFVGEVEGRAIRFHDGGNAGFASFNILLPEDDAVIILLSNVEANIREISLHLVTEVLLTQA